MRKIPTHLSHLPVYRGYPVPYFVPEVDGKFIFKYADKKKILACVQYHKCCICFKPLIKGVYWFVSGPQGFKNCVDSHPPMHEECARYSLEICPHLFHEKAERTTDGEGQPEYLIREKPKEFFLVKAKDYDLHMPGGNPLFRYKPVSSTKFIYTDGKLRQE